MATKTASAEELIETLLGKDQQHSADDPEWPDLAPEALAGLPGDIVRAFEDQTEADPAAMLTTVLAMFGNCAGRTPHIWIGETRHGTNEFINIVGKTSRSRKGTSGAGPKRLFQSVDEPWLSGRQISSFGSGEGMIWQVRDPSDPKTDKKGETIIEDPGVADKRLMIFEEEISGLFTVSGKDGSILSETVRKAWDAPQVLHNAVKRSPIRATNAHISIIGHITVEESRRKLTETDKANGVGNRFMWALARRSKTLSMPQRVSDQSIAPLARELHACIAHARSVAAITLDDDARRLWDEVYPILSEDYTGLFGSLIARAEAHAIRLALIYALMDRSAKIAPHHLLSALAFWRYCEDSARYIFGESTGDGVADRILDALKASPEGLTETAISEVLGRHESSGRIKAALMLLAQHGKVSMKEARTRGRPAHIWTANANPEKPDRPTDYLEIARAFVRDLTSHSSPFSQYRPHTNGHAKEDGNYVDL